jgi:nicotinate phosphoribosyltransferase
MVDGELVEKQPSDQQSLDQARETLRRSLAELPISATQLSRGDAVIPTVYENTAYETT